VSRVITVADFEDFDGPPEFRAEVENATPLLIAFTELHVGGRTRDEALNKLRDRMIAFIGDYIEEARMR